MIQSVFAKRWREQWHGLVLPGGNIAGKGPRYPSDLTDREWALSAPFIPPAKTGGRQRSADMREVVNALLYIAASGGTVRNFVREAGCRHQMTNLSSKITTLRVYQAGKCSLPCQQVSNGNRSNAPWTPQNKCGPCKTN